jgi:BlaI family transcriptional regulator, penicillinase repressor
MRLSDTEWTVMRAVWARGPASARDVLEAVTAETGWAYTTVKTLLARLVEKGALSERKRANQSIYEPLVTARTARVAALRALVDRAFDGVFGSLVQHLVAEERLSDRDRAALRAMLEADEAPSPAPAAAPDERAARRASPRRRAAAASSRRRRSS